MLPWSIFESKYKQRLLAECLMPLYLCLYFFSHKYYNIIVLLEMMFETSVWIRTSWC